ncbi:MAG TPA: phenylalanine--tRNA ligase subunit beta [Pirellulales bacterium]|jgi:phenylalanyl-tRNA synthetase beta chain|nr:phenylalanine--tRNA ligase subunit beta [Pirellulales bacterium]
MLLSFAWLKDYIAVDVPAEELARRLMLAGLNHETTSAVGDDLAIDLEVTSNRPDCLGHIGVAREVAVLFDRPLSLPAAEPAQSKAPVERFARVALDCPALCPRYTARVIRGVRVRPSPAWLAARLATIGIAAINNVVDATNYVLMECGQPLHAFDLQKLAGGEIIVREAKAGEKFAAINHKTYDLEPSMCVIADRDRAVAIGGVMGGAESEVSESTTELLIESAEFDPMSIRRTARRLNLHSDSSYRFERGVDPEAIDWASRRVCELILELAGGELAAGVVDVGRRPTARPPITLRFDQLRRILGIEIAPAEVRRILAALGLRETHANATGIAALAPSWRRDLSREIDLVEEVARIHGYDAIPEDVSVPMASSHRRSADRVLGRVREALLSAGLDEAMTISVVEPAVSDAFSPWTDAPPLAISTPILRRADRLRRSLIPSLLVARRTNEALANSTIELFETARVYLARPDALPSEELMLAIASGRDFLTVKGILELMLKRLNPRAALEVVDYRNRFFTTGRAAELRIKNQHGGDPHESRERFGILGEISPATRQQFELRSPATVAEVRIVMLEKIAVLVPQAVELSPYPAVERDVNLVVAELVHWADVAESARLAAGPDLERLTYQDTYRDAQRLGADRKSLLMTLTLRRADRTLTSTEADTVRDAVVAACVAKHGAQLRA